MKKLLPVNFNGDTIYLVGIDGEPFVPIRPIAENLGLKWSGQHSKLQEDAKRWQVKIIKAEAQDGKSREMLCLPLRKLPAWLMSISPSKVKPEIRKKLIKYQEECDQVLWSYWLKGRAENPRLNGKTEEPQALPFCEYEYQGYSYLWYLPLGLLARILQVEPDDILKLLPPGTYIKNPELVNFLRERFPEASRYLKDPTIVFDTGLRRLFIKNLIAREGGVNLPEPARKNGDELEEFKKKLFRALESLERRKVSFSLARKVVRARKAGLTHAEISKALGLDVSKISRLEQDLKAISVWSAL